MASRIALITGCSSGIGMVSALRLAKRSKEPLIVYATMRNLVGKREIEQAAGSALNDRLFIRELDVTREETIVDTISHIKSEHGRLDILVNNAGIAGPCITEATKLETFKKMFDTNFFGVVRVTQEVIPMMKQQMSGKIINISSIAGFAGFTFYEMYGSSKFALEGFTECMATTMRHFNVWVSSVQPGPVSTNVQHNPDVSDILLAQRDDQNVDHKTRELYRQCIENRKQFLEASGAQPSEEVADIVEEIVDDPTPHLRYQTSEMAKDLAHGRFKDPTGDEWINGYY